MKNKETGKNPRKTPAGRSEQGQSCCALANLEFIGIDPFENMTWKIGDLWLMISLFG